MGKVLEVTPLLSTVIKDPGSSIMSGKSKPNFGKIYIIPLHKFLKRVFYYWGGGLLVLVLILLLEVLVLVVVLDDLIFETSKRPRQGWTKYSYLKNSVLAHAPLTPPSYLDVFNGSPLSGFLSFKSSINKNEFIYSIK